MGPPEEGLPVEAVVVEAGAASRSAVRAGVQQ